MTDAVLPTLQSGTQKILKTRASICNYIIYFFFTNPGDISTTFPNLISFRKIEAEHETSPDEMSKAIAYNLEEAMNRYLPGRMVSVEVRRQEVDEAGKYGFNINVQGADGSVVQSRDVEVNENGGVNVQL